MGNKHFFKNGQGYMLDVKYEATNDAKSLDVYNFGTSDGSNVCQWTYYGNSCQKWVFEACSN